MLFDSDALGHEAGRKYAPDAILHILDGGAFLFALCQVNHARTVLPGHNFLGIVIEMLPNNQDYLAIVWGAGDRKGGVAREGDIPGHLLPEITELVSRLPDIVTRGVHRTLLCAV